MKKYKIKSMFDALILIDNRPYELGSEKMLTVEDGNDILSFAVYPIIHRQSSLTPFVVNSNKESPHVKVFEFKKCSFILLEESDLAERFYVRSVNVKNHTVKIKVTPVSVCFETNEHGLSAAVCEPYKSFRAFAARGFACAYLLGDVETLLLYNPTDNHIEKLKGESVKIEDNIVTMHVSEKGIAKHALKIVAEIGENSIIQRERTLLYKNARPGITRLPNLYPTAFLEAIRIKDYPLARAYLSAPLEGKLKDEHLDGFFIPFTTIEVVETCENSQTVLLFDGRAAKLYRFDFDSYITNIEELS